MENSTSSYDSAIKNLGKDNKKLPAEDLKKLNEILYLSERFLTNKEGLPNRPWYIHEIYAPGFYTGYGVKTIPGVREAIEQRDWKQADEQIKVVSE